MSSWMMKAWNTKSCGAKNKTAYGGGSTNTCLFFLILLVGSASFM